MSPDRSRLASWIVQRLRSSVVRNSRDVGRERQLLSLGEAAVAPLVAELRAPEPQVRSWAARLLSRIGGEEALTALRPLARALEPETRLAVGKALASVNDPLAVDVLAAIADSGELAQWMRYEALHALGDLGDPRGALPVMLHCFEAEPVNLRMAAMAALKQLGTPAVPSLIDLGRTAEPSLRASALHCLAHIGEPMATDFALQQLNDPDRDVRVAAIACVGRFRPPDASIMLEVRLSDPEPAIRHALCEALGALGQRDAVPHLIQRLKEDANPGVRAAAARALGRCGDAEASIPLLHVLLASDDYPLLHAALSGIAELGDARILDLLKLFEPRRLRSLPRKERLELQRKADYAAGRIRARLK